MIFDPVFEGGVVIRAEGFDEEARDLLEMRDVANGLGTVDLTTGRAPMGRDGLGVGNCRVGCVDRVHPGPKRFHSSGRVVGQRLQPLGVKIVLDEDALQHGRGALSIESGHRRAMNQIRLYLAAVGIYYFERGAQPDKFASVFDGLWWAAATLTTVGYGNVYPTTVGPAREAAEQLRQPLELDVLRRLEQPAQDRDGGLAHPVARELGRDDRVVVRPHRAVVIGHRAVAPLARGSSYEYVPAG